MTGTDVRTGSCRYLLNQQTLIIAAIATPIAKSQHMREIWFYVMSGGVVLKVAVMEIARIIQLI